MSKPKRKFEPQKLDRVISEIITQKPLQGGILNERIKTVWEQQMGTHVMAYTRKVRFEKGVLYVYLSSAPLAEELRYAKEKIIKNLNEAVGNAVIEKLVLR